MMYRNQSISVSETLLITRNPRSVFLLCYENKCYVAATGVQERVTKLPNDPSILHTVIYGNTDKNMDNMSFYPVTPSIWPVLRDIANEVQPNLWPSEATYEDHLIQAVKALLDYDYYEKDAFPTCMNPYIKAKKESDGDLTFEEHYRKTLVILARENQPLWICWGYLIRQGIPLYSLRYFTDDRIRSLKEPKKCMYQGCQKKCISHCARCAWKCYCSREHQISDWFIHKRECCSYF